MKYDNEYLEQIKNQKEIQMGIELLYKGGVGCGFFLIGLSSIVFAINYCFN